MARRNATGEHRSQLPGNSRRVARNDDLFSAAGMRRSRDACDLMFFGRRNAMLEQFERIMLTDESRGGELSNAARFLLRSPKLGT